MLKLVTAHQKNLRRTILSRDILEWSVSLLLAYNCLRGSYSHPSHQTTFLLCGCLSLFPMSYLSWRTWRIPEKPPMGDLPLVDSFRLSLNWLKEQVALLRAVGWWYILPLGLVAYLLGPFYFQQPTVLAVQRVGCLFLFWFVHRINQKAALELEEHRQQLQVVVEEMSRTE